MSVDRYQTFDLRGVLLRVLVELALRQPDKSDRDAMLEILRKDGWLDGENIERKAA